MVSQRDLNKVVEQVNSSYKLMMDKISTLEAQVASLTQKEAKVKK
jgi:prefoldin subunit 5